MKTAGKKGLGAFAKRIIRQGEFIGEFAGEVVRQSPCCTKSVNNTACAMATRVNTCQHASLVLRRCVVI